MSQTETSTNKSIVIVIVVLGVAIGAAIAYWLFSSPNSNTDEIKPAETITEPAPKVEPEPEPIETIVEEPKAEPIIESEPIVEDVIEPKVELPALDNSDELVQSKLSELTWRKELLRLVIDEDMIRRFVVFTENFANGSIVYDHSPLVTPDANFTATESEQDTWQWDTASSNRYNLYVELLQSMDTEQLVDWYIELKPLVDDAYAELGYPDTDFTDTLKLAIARILDMKFPDSSLELERPSVMFKYKDKSMESMPDADKLLLRIGKQNLLVIKSILLKVDERLIAN